MDGTEPGLSSPDFEALKALEADASELERIENLLDRFNVFEAIGFIGQEIMHSRFLAFLLDPSQSHGLGDLFLKRFSQKVSESSDKVSLPEDFDRADDGSPSSRAVLLSVIVSLPDANIYNSECKGSGRGFESQHVGHRQRQKMGDSPFSVDRVDLYSWILQLDSLPLHRRSCKAAQVGVLGNFLPNTFRASNAQP